MEYFVVLSAYVLILCLLIFVRNNMHRVNPYYSLVDDILLFSGIPVTFGYFLYVIINPENNMRLFSEVVDENREMMFLLLFWMVVSSLVFFWRNRKSRRLYG